MRMGQNLFVSVGNLSTQVMDVLQLEEIPLKHILKQWTRDARDILPGHLVHYQKDNALNTSFTWRHSTLYAQAMEVVRMGDASAESFQHMCAGLKAFSCEWGTFRRKEGRFRMRTVWPRWQVARQWEG